MFLTALFDYFGWTRDDLKWLIGVIAAVVIGLATLSDSAAAAFGISAHVLPYIRLGAFIVGIVSANYKTSGLRGKMSAWLLPLLLVGGIAVTTTACGTHASPKVILDLTDRPAYAALKAFDTAEEQAYHAHAAWPTPAQHQAMSAQFVHAYQLVIDVARIGVALPPGATLTADDLAAVSQLTGLIADFATAVGQPSVSADVQTAFANFNVEAQKLLDSVKGQ